MRLAFLFSALTLAACGSPGSTLGAGTNSADCTDIYTACHPVDPGSGALHDCHENSEGTWSAAQCSSNKSRCLVMCADARDAGG